MSTHKPLWQVMKAAHDRDVGTVEDVYGNEYPGRAGASTYAAEIRALVEARLPEEDPIDLMQVNFADIEQLARWIARDERQRLRALLLADAEEAEAGAS